MPARKYSKNNKKSKNKSRKNNKNKKSNASSSASSSTPASGLSTPMSGQSTPSIEEIPTVTIESTPKEPVPVSAPLAEVPAVNIRSTPKEPAPVSTPDLVFMDLTCDRDHDYDICEQEPSTHDLAELMLYSFVDSSPYVADFIYSKQLLKQGEFLTLTDEKDWLDVPTIEFSTHEPYY